MLAKSSHIPQVEHSGEFCVLERSLVKFFLAKKKAKVKATNHVCFVITRRYRIVFTTKRLQVFKISILIYYTTNLVFYALLILNRSSETTFSKHICPFIMLTSALFFFIFFTVYFLPLYIYCILFVWCLSILFWIILFLSAQLVCYSNQNV
jgi:hypothetical protein